MSDYSKSALLTFLETAVENGLMQPATANARQVAVSRLLTDLTEGEEADVRTIDVHLAAEKLANRSGNEISAETLAAYRRRAAIAIDEFAAWVEDPEGYQPSDGDWRGRRRFVPGPEHRPGQGHRPPHMRGDGEHVPPHLRREAERLRHEAEDRPVTEEEIEHLREARGGRHQPSPEEIENLRESRRGGRGRHAGRGFGGGRGFGFGGEGRSGGLPMSFPLRPDFIAQLVLPRDLTTAEAKRLGAFLLTLASDYEPSV